MQIGCASAQHGAQEVVQKQECYDVEEGTDWTKGQHEPSQCPARPVFRSQSLFFVYMVPRQNDAQNIVQQVQ